MNIFTLPVGTLPNNDSILEAIKWNDSYNDSYTQLDNYYLGIHAILSREKSYALANTKVVANHCKYITDINVGYLLGNPVDYQVREPLTYDDIQPITKMFRSQTISDVDVELATDVSKFGRAYEYIFVNKDGMIKSVLIDPRNAVVVYDDSIEHNPMWAVLYERDADALNKKDAPIVKMTVLTTNQIKYYAEVNGKFIVKELLPHSFGDVPVIEYQNNKQIQGDYEQVITLVNAYNFLQSDRVNDKIQLVESILALYGFAITQEQKEDLMLYRMLADIPVDGKAEYLTKTFDESQVEILRNAIEQDIHKISMTPNMSDKEFVGNSSGVAIAYKLLPFEQNVKNKERNMEAGMKKRFKLYNNHLAFLSKMNVVDVSDVDVVFKRNMPKNDFETSQTISNLRGLVSNETLISQLSFVKDAREEIKVAHKDSLVGMNVELPEYGTPDATLETLEEKGLVQASAKQDSLLTKLKNLING